MIAGLVIGVFASRPDAGPVGWHAYVASYQALYVTDTLAEVTQSPEATATQLAKVSGKLGRPLGAATTIPGLTYKRAQVLGFNGAPLAQLAYLGKDGAPLALCILAKTEAAALETMKLEGMEAASWSDGNYAYLLIGGQDAEQIAQAATHLKAAL